MITCKFFTRGICRNGDFCYFVHESVTTKTNDFTATVQTLPAIEKLSLNTVAVTQSNEADQSYQICRFFLQGSCNKNEKCRFLHPPTEVVPRQVILDSTLPNSQLDWQNDSSPSLPSDSRGSVPCRFFSSPGGCRNKSCSYMHATNGHNAVMDINKTFEAEGEEDQEHKDDDDNDDFTRSLLGATVYFDEVGRILKVSFTTDFSLACITGLEPEITPEGIVSILHDYGFNVTSDCVRITRSTESSKLKATVKVEDPHFALELSLKLNAQRSAYSAALLPINIKQTNSRKVYISWHKSTRSVWVNYGSGDIANRVAEKFNDGRYKCLGQYVKSSRGKCTTRGFQRGHSNRVAWTIVLTDVPGNATVQDIEVAIRILSDKPRHIELGPVSYQASDPEVSVAVRTHLEEHGPLESFYLAPTQMGKRAKATALFIDEADARSSCSLDNQSLEILGKGKLTVTLLQSAKIKVPTMVYLATKGDIDESNKKWRDQRVGFHAYPNIVQHFTTLKLEGSGFQDVSDARKTLNRILSGTVLMTGDTAIWDSSLNRNGSAYKKLKSIEKELQILIIRDKLKRQLQFYGPPAKLERVADRVTGMLGEESSSKNRTQNQDEPNLSFKGASRNLALLSTPSSERECAICFDELVVPIHMSCNHSYCFECFEAFCKFNAASTNKEEFRVECQGDGGSCAKVFNLAELKAYLSSNVFELVLKSAFQIHVQRHKDKYQFCPTPDCDHVYRSTSASDSKPILYTCANCFEQVCTSCHARHGEYTCAEYKEIQSGDYEANEELKRQLRIKSCPQCKTLMEKIEGCNHMTCGSCGAHICWICMTVFKMGGHCYSHMLKEHGSIGLGENYD